jgi:hypothetical protein
MVKSRISRFADIRIPLRDLLQIADRCKYLLSIHLASTCAVIGMNSPLPFVPRVLKMVVGYARSSTVDQVAGFEAQFKELSAAGCEKIFQEQVSSVTVRLQLQSALEFVRDGDVFVVTKLDRLARSVAGLMAILQALERKGVAVRILNLAWTPKRPPAS